jgi:RNA polymerase sigma-70 factor (ECF subfamily)
MDDADLVRQVLQGNLGAYMGLVKRYTAQIAALCRAHLPRRPDVVDDLVQETFCRGLDQLAALREPGCFGYWLYAIARNLCRKWRKDPHNHHLSLDAGAAQPLDRGPAEDDWPDRAAELKECISGLPLKLRVVVEIYYAGGRVTYRELADRLGMSFGQVNKLLTRARKELRQCLQCQQTLA